MTGVNGVVADARVIAQAAADELERSDRGTSVQAVLDRYVNRAQSRYRRAVAGARCHGRPTSDDNRRSGRRPARSLASVVRAGPWSHLTPPDHIPAAVGHGRFRGHPQPWRDGRRADRADRAGGGAQPLEGVEHRRRRADRRGGVDGDRGDVRHPDGRPVAGAGPDARQQRRHPDQRGGGAKLVCASSATRTGRKLVLEPRVFVPIKDWVTQETAGVTARVRVAPGDMFRRLASAQGRGMAEASALILGIITLLFLVIEVAALAMGLALARSITGSIHELFAGHGAPARATSRHRITLRSRDQLGELADRSTR